MFYSIIEIKVEQKHKVKKNVKTFREGRRKK